MVEIPRTNIFDQNSPEWQLYENMQAARHLAMAAAEDVQRYTEKAKAAREKEARYRSALETLLSASESNAKP